LRIKKKRDLDEFDENPLKMNASLDNSKGSIEENISDMNKITD